MKYTVKFTNRFQKDIALVKRQGKQIDKLFQIVELLAEGNALPQKNRDHALEGIYSTCRECHIEPDWLLIYRIEDNLLQLILMRTGSHSNLF